MVITGNRNILIDCPKGKLIMMISRYSRGEEEQEEDDRALIKVHASTATIIVVSMK